MSDWDAQASTLDDAWQAVWAAEDVDAGVNHCLERVLDGLPLKPGSSVVDIGCGIGRLAVPLARTRPDVMVVGYDISPMMLTWAAGYGDGIPNVRWQLGGRLPQVRHAYSVLTFQHLTPEEINGYLRAIGGGALLPNGVLRFQFAVGDVHAPHHHTYGVDEMVGMCATAGLEVTSVEPDNMFDVWAWITASRP